jgi:heme/copper-type cytochrome/quinol oxidase subunit 2
MSDLAHTPLRLTALVIAAIAIVPTAFLILRHLVTLRDPALGRRAQFMDVVWTVAPLVAVVGLLVASGLA